MDNGLIFPYRLLLVKGDGEGQASRVMVVPVQAFEVLKAGENSWS
jgi:hypothetical protein